jgi:hypothetical protein
MRPYKEVWLTRQQVYDMIWSRPMRDVARELGFSDVGLKKLCRRGIPTPQGYHLMESERAKMRLVKPLEQPSPRQQQKFLFRMPDPAIEQARQAAKARAQDDFHGNPRVLTNAERATIRQVIARVQSKLDRRKLDERGMVRSPGREFPIRVAPASFARATSILTELFEQAFSRGAAAPEFSESDRRTLSFNLDGFRFTTQIEESSKRLDVTPDRRPRQSDYLYVNQWRLMPTGILTLKMWGSMYQTRSLRDGRVPIEQRLHEILEWVYESVAVAKEEARVKEIRRTRAIAHLLEQDKERQKLEFEKRRQRQFEQEARKWRRAEALLGYLTTIESAGYRASQRVFESEDAWRDWLSWAHRYVDTINPITLGVAGTTPPYPDPVQIEDVNPVFLDYDDPAEAMRVLRERRW